MHAIDLAVVSAKDLCDHLSEACQFTMISLYIVHVFLESSTLTSIFLSVNMCYSLLCQVKSSFRNPKQSYLPKEGRFWKIKMVMEHEELSKLHGITHLSLHFTKLVPFLKKLRHLLSV